MVAVTETGQRIRVLICDDSPLTREMLAQIIGSDPIIDVIGFASDGQQAVELVSSLRPDLVTMDIHMPKVDGLEATRRIMAYTPVPILVVSSSVYGEGMGLAFEALQFGALEVIKKPEPKDWADLERIGRDIIRKIKILSRVKVITHVSGRDRDRKRDTAQVPQRQHRASREVGIVAIGSSTGGPSALHAILSQLPENFPVPIVIAQHIADGFIPGLVDWLDNNCGLHVAEAQQDQAVLPGTAYFAPTGRNLEVVGSRTQFVKPQPGQLYIPSADTLLASVAKSYGRRSLGVILTGMGADGAKGLRAMHDLGAYTVAQDEATSVVYGMPRAAKDAGAVDKVLPIERIADAIVNAVVSV